MNEWLALELDDDPATLQAALDMVDALHDGEYGADEVEVSTAPQSLSDTTDSGDAATTPTTSETSLPLQEATAKEPLAKRRRRSAFKEIQQLRKNVAQLEGRLRTLKRSRTNTERGEEEDGGTDAAEESAPQPLTLVNVWADLARRQQRQRHASEQEQVKLRHLLHTQVSVGQQLMQLVRESHSDPSPSPSMPSSGVPIDVSPRVTEEQLIAHVETLFLEAETAFSVPRFHQGPLAFRDIRVADDGPQCTVVNTHVSWLVPFPTVDVRATLWELTTRARGSSRCPMSNVSVNSTDERVIMAFGAETRTTRTTVSDQPMALTGTVVFKRFGQSEDATALIVSSMYGELTGLRASNVKEEDSRAPMTVTEEAWMRVQAIAAPTTSDREDMHVAQVQVSRRVTLRFPGDQSSNRRRLVNFITELVLTQIEETLTWKQQMMENILLRVEEGDD